MIVLPFKPSEPDQQFTVQLGESQYTFRALWNERATLWHMDVYEIDGTPIMRSIAIVLGTFLGRTSTHALFRSGSFVAVDLTRTQTDAGLDDIGTAASGGRVEVRYFSNDEVLAQLASTGFVS